MAFDLADSERETPDLQNIVLPDSFYIRINGVHIQIALSWSGKW